jgi:hypothetical protein
MKESGLHLQWLLRRSFEEDTSPDALQFSIDALLAQFFSICTTMNFYVEAFFPSPSHLLAGLLVKATLPTLDNPFSERVHAIIQKTREMRRGVYYPHLYIVKEDGEPPLKLWALGFLIQDRADVLPSYQQFIS